MRLQPLTPLRRGALRTAAISTAVVALLLVVLLTATDLLVSRNLTAGVDDRLRDELNRMASLPLRIESVGEQDFDVPVIRWLISSSGGVSTEAGSPALPAGLMAVSGFVTADIAGTVFRLTGKTLSDGRRMVVAASLQPANHATATLLISELILGPLLLLAVFGGSLMVGRRVGGPIEAMRQRQLDFTADASHELRTPLTVIQAETSLLREDATGETLASLQRISGESDRMRRIVEDLLWLARFDTEPRAPTSEPVDLGTLAAGAVERFRTMAASRAVELQLSAPADAIVVELPPEWLDRLAAVLIDNACRYSRRGGTVAVDVTADGGRPRLAVRDSGPGVPADQRERIFTRFHRGTTEGDGAGLGLAIADAVVQSTEGRWEIANLSGGGAEFAVSWRRPRHPAPVGDPVPASAAPG